MTTSGSEIRPRTHSPFGATAAVSVVALALIFALSFAFSGGRGLHEGAVAAESAAIENEDHTFCSGFGFAREFDMYVRCRDGLAEIRRTQQDRTNEAAIGMF